MSRRSFDEDTVSNSERVLERLTSKPIPNNIPEAKPVVIGRVQNFTCPGCQEVIPEVLTINGRVRGWCGKAHTYISKEV